MSKEMPELSAEEQPKIETEVVLLEEESFQKQLKQEFPFIEKAIEFNDDYKEVLGPWSRTDAVENEETRKLMFEFYKGRDSRLIEIFGENGLSEDEVSFEGLDQNNYEDVLGELSDKQLEDVWKELVGSLEQIKENVLEVLEEFPRSDSSVEKSEDYRGLAGDWFRGAVKTIKEYEKMYEKIGREVEDLKSQSEDKQSLLAQYLIREKLFKNESEKYFKEKDEHLLTQTQLEVAEDVDVKEWERMFGPDWQESFVGIMPEEFLSLIGGVKILNRGKSYFLNGKEYENQGGYNHSTRKIEIVTKPNNQMTGSGDYIRIFGHELGHAVTYAEEQERQTGIKLRFLQAFVKEPENFFSFYAAETLRNRGVIKGLEDDFADTFSEFLTRPGEMEFFNPERHRAMESIMRRFYPNVDVGRIREMVWERVNAEHS